MILNLLFGLGIWWGIFYRCCFLDWGVFLWRWNYLVAGYYFVKDIFIFWMCMFIVLKSWNNDGCENFNIVYICKYW